MINRKEKVIVEDGLETVVELNGNGDSGKVIYFLHGFGVGRDARGMFLDIERVLLDDYLCVRFDLNLLNEKDEVVIPALSVMGKMFNGVIDYVESNFSIIEENCIAHSLGCMVGAMQKNIKYSSFVLLAPPLISPYKDRINYYQNRGDVINLSKVSKLSRSDGTVSILMPSFLHEEKESDPLKNYIDLSSRSHLFVLKPLQDQLLQYDYRGIKQLDNISYKEISGDHDFTGRSRSELIEEVRKIFERIV